MSDAPSIRPDGLQLEEHRGFQERFWTIERIAWIAFGIIALLALVGLTGGGGMLAQQTLSLDAGEVTYPRVTRWEATDEIRVTFAADGPERRLTLSQSFAEHFQIEDIQPEPDSTAATAAGELMVFRAEQGQPAQVTLHMRALSPGLASFEIGLGEGERRPVSSLILP